jgi:hypothetical protein
LLYFLLHSLTYLYLFSVSLVSFFIIAYLLISLVVTVLFVYNFYL